MVWLIVALVVAWIVWSQVRRSKRVRSRRESLHHDGAGYWVWTDFDGSTQRSKTHPDDPGGAWFSSGGHSGGGHDGGFDGGGFDGGDGGGGD